MSDKYIAIGAGVSGIESSRLLKDNGEDVTLYDGNKELDKESLIEKHSFLSDIDIICGDIDESVMNNFDIAVVSPGVPLDSDIVKLIKKCNVKIWGEIELAFHYSKGRIAGITGTNGKTTTTALTGEILGAYYDDVRVCGNIGTQYTSMVKDSTDDTVFVLELSSFQLDTIISFRPDVSAILNITPDHLDRHHTMDNYIGAKKNITLNQSESDVCVLNYEDSVLRDFGAGLDKKVIYFSSERELDNGLFVRGDSIYCTENGTVNKIIDVNELTILGKHNFENAMCAIAIGLSMGVPVDVIVKALKSFKAVEHRIEYVCDRNGVSFYNDSKATNTDAAIKGICAMNRPTFLIGGGYDKDATYDEWVDCFDNRVKKLVLIGTTKEKIAVCCKSHNFNDYVFADTLEEAVDICFDEAVPGDAILLSPACASWDMFKGYEERGRCFKDHARQYKDS